MTICIAAISEKNKIIAITDRMLTLEVPVMTTYEINENNKAIDLNENVIALFAGDVTQANEILLRAKEKLKQAKPTSTKEIAEIVNAAFTEHWSNIMDNFLLRKFKITFQQFMHSQSAFDADLVKQISQFISKFNINVEIIVAGKHIDETEGHIYVMDSMGTVVSQDAIGYACIGSGSRHATFSLIESEASNTCGKSETLLDLIKAKKRAEYDPGVGKLCDIVILDKNIKRLKTEEVREILTIFNESITKHKKIDAKILVELTKKI